MSEYAALLSAAAISILTLGAVGRLAAGQKKFKRRAAWFILTDIGLIPATLALRGWIRGRLWINIFSPRIGE